MNGYTILQHANCGSLLTSPHSPPHSIPPPHQLPSSVTAAVIKGNTKFTFDWVVIEDLLLFSNLVFLDVSGNNLRFSDFAVLPSLQDLCMANNHIANIDCPVSGYKQLQKLDLSYNELTEKALAKLGTHFQSKLVYLNISNNQLSGLPKEICHLGELETLLLDNNQCCNTQLSLLGFLSRLKVLSLNNNKITKYLHHSGIFSCLSCLYLNYNQITTLQDLMELTKLSCLTNVYLAYNPLKADEFGGSIDMPAVFEPKQKIQFITKTNSFMQFNVVNKDQEQKINHTSQAHNSSLLTEEDWIPDFILVELYGLGQPVKKSIPSMQVLNALRSTVLHPPTLHLPPQKRTSMPRQQIHSQIHNSYHGGIDLDEDSQVNTSYNVNSVDTSRSISTLSEAEAELALMKQRLFAAESHFGILSIHSLPSPSTSLLQI